MMNRYSDVYFEYNSSVILGLHRSHSYPESCIELSFALNVPLNSCSYVDICMLDAIYYQQSVDDLARNSTIYQGSMV